MHGRRSVLFHGCTVLIALLCATSFLHCTHIPLESSAAWAEERNEWRATGKGRIKTDDAQGILIARRAALTDARRNLLLSQGYEVGRVGPHRVASEWREGDIYYVEVVARGND